MKKSLTPLKNESGSLVIDFMFAITLVMSLTMILFSLAITLSAVEMTQYLTFSSARAYYASHISKEDQSRAAQTKFQQILGTEAYSFLAEGGWFELQTPFIGDVTTVSELGDYGSSDGKPNRFIGVVTYFSALILSFESPIWGSTNTTGDDARSTFSTHIGSYLGREPTVEECMEFSKKRWEYIRQLTVARGGADYSNGTDENNFTEIADNGC